MKKVLITLNNSKLSGIERFTLLLVEQMQGNDFTFTVALPTYGQFSTLLKEKNINFFVFNNKVNGSYTLSGIWNLTKHFFFNKYDIVHAQAGIIPCILGFLSGVKLILEHKHGLDFTDEEIASFDFMKMYYEKIKKYFVDYTITVCERDKLILTEKFSYDKSKVINVYNGIKKVNIDRKEKAAVIKIGTIGRLTYQKAQEYFVEMAKKVLNIRDNCMFEIYGDGENLSKIRDLISSNNLNEYVKLMGYTDNVNKVLSSFDIFVLTSRYEGIPYVLLEAMNQQLPIVTSNVGGISEVIEHGYNGFLVEKENSDLLAEAVINIISNESLKTKIALNAKNTFEAKFTLEKTIDCIRSIYSFTK